MSTQQPPYWYWRADRWKVVVAAVLALVLVILAVRACNAPESQAARLTFTALGPGGRLTQGSLGDVTGSAQPNAQVLLFDGDVVLGKTIADAKGKWRLTLPALAAGAHELRVQVVGADGKVAATSAPQKVAVIAWATTPSGTATPTLPREAAEATAKAVELTPPTPSPVPSAEPTQGAGPTTTAAVSGATEAAPEPSSTPETQMTAPASATPGAVTMSATARATTVSTKPAVVTVVATPPSGTAAAATTPATPDGGCTEWYTVQQGDTLNKIAARYDTTASYLATLNKLSDPDLILPGQKLCVRTSAPSNGTYYTVKKGDTLGTIGAQFGWSAAYLAQVNNISNPDLIYPGQALFIPSH